jgi:ribosome-associated protein
MSPLLRVPIEEIEFRASRARGPGGQNVNRRETRIEARWNVLASDAVNDEERARILRRLASRISKDGVLRVVAYKERSQQQNKALALARLQDLVIEALEVPKRRVKTRPPEKARETRLRSKRRRSRIKQMRKRPSKDE